MTPYIIILVTAKDKKQAQSIVDGLLANKLIACANIIAGVESIFLWQGKKDKATEVLLILKTKKTLFPLLVKEVKKRHTYETPEIIALPIIAGSSDYLNWIKTSVKG